VDYVFYILYRNKFRKFHEGTFSAPYTQSREFTFVITKFRGKKIAKISVGDKFAALEKLSKIFYFSYRNKFLKFREGL
jgi:hypothetical protein